MLRRFRHLILSASLLIVLGHGWMPHGHERVHQSARFTASGRPMGLLLFLEALLAQDGGYGHLEDYAPGLTASFLPSEGLPAPQPLFEAPAASQGLACPVRPDGCYVPFSGLRSPPPAV
jgi:hypothetical protein